MKTEQWKANFSSLPLISQEEAIALLQEQGVIESKKLPALNLFNRTWEREIFLKNCQIQELSLKGTKFQKKITLQNCWIERTLEMSAYKKNQDFFPTVLYEGMCLRDCLLGDWSFRTGESKGTILAEDCCVQGCICFDRSVFEKTVSFILSGEAGIFTAYRAKFLESLSWENYSFFGIDNRSFDINGASIAKTFSLIHVTMQHSLECKKAVFGQKGIPSFSIVDSSLHHIDIGEAIFHGAVFFQNVEIKGNFTAEFPKDTHGQKIGKTTTFDEDACFEKVRFQNKCTFHGTRFQGYSNFKECLFAKGGIFNQAEFLQYAGFWQTESQDALHFRKAHFAMVSNFGSVTFGAKSSFNEAIFSGKAIFFEAKTQGDIFFTSAHFEDDFQIRKFQCKGGITLKEIIVDGVFNISNSKIDDRLILSDSRIHGNLEATGLSVGTWASLHGCTVKGEANLAGIKIGHKILPSSYSIQSRCDENEAEEKKQEDLELAETGDLEEDKTEQETIEKSKTEPAEKQEASKEGKIEKQEASEENTAEKQEASELPKKSKTEKTKKTKKEEVVVPGTLYLSKTCFKSTLDLTAANITGDLNAEGINIHNDAEWIRIRVGNDILLSKSYFRGILRCNNSFFRELVSYKTRYKEEVCLDSVHCSNTNMKSSSFDGGLTMRYSKIEGKVNLNNVDVDGKVDLFQCEFQKIFFKNLLASYFLIQKQDIGEFVASEGLQNYQQAKNEYGILKQAFQVQSRYQDMDWAYYRFCRSNRKSKTVSFQSPLQSMGVFLDWLFLDLGFGYGTRPMNIAVVALITIFSFGLVLYCVPAGISNVNALQFLDALYLSTLTFASMDYGDCSPAFDHWLKYLLAIEGVLGIFLTTLFVATVSRKIIRT